MKFMKLAIIGYGKMGKTILRLAPNYAFSEFVIIDNEEDWLNKQDALKNCDVAIEFSTPQTVSSNLMRCFELHLPVVSGTTGSPAHEEAFLSSMKNKSISFVYGSNFSIGANIFFKLNKYLAQQMNLQRQYQVSIEETHHVHKKDAPSGTALTIKQTILSQFDTPLSIPVVSHREGEVIGEHLVTYKSDEDLIEIKHCAQNRDSFAHGALKAAVWLLQHPGVYAFEEIF